MSGGEQTRMVVTSLASPQVGPLVLQAYLDLHRRGFHNGRFDLNPTKHVILIEITRNNRDWEPAAVSMFLLSTEQRVLWVDLVYVLEEWRGRGIARDIFEWLKKTARDNNMLSMEYGTSVKNQNMRAAAKRLGHQEMAVLVSVPVDVAE